jgi:hypothetical protein
MASPDRKESGIMIKRISLAAVSLGIGAAAMLTFAAQGAQASTPGCTGGAYTGYCGTQADQGKVVVVIDSSRQSTAYNNPVIGWTNSSSDPGTDWLQLPYDGNAALGVMFVFAPGGVVSNMCASDPGNSHVVLRTCNGSNWQRWIPSSGTIHSWTNRATHRILTGGAVGEQLVTTPTTSEPDIAQLWSFSH